MICFGTSMSSRKDEGTSKRILDHAAASPSSSSSSPPKKNQNERTRLRPLSHGLAKVLRHKALDMGLPMTPDGYVPVQAILDCKQSGKSLRGYSLEDVRQVVETCDKQRFKLEERPAASYYGETRDHHQDGTTVLCIRANHGHSIAIVDPDLLLERLDVNALRSLPVIVHGTYREAWKSIQQQGLKRMTRNHIHFASGLPKEDGVISGMRKSCEVFIYVDAQKCARDGVAFYRSDNGVLLTAGLKDEGTLPTDYFLRVTDASGADISTTGI